MMNMMEMLLKNQNNTELKINFLSKFKIHWKSLLEFKHIIIIYNIIIILLF
jgi:hypothetical protein